MPEVKVNCHGRTALMHQVYEALNEAFAKQEAEEEAGAEEEEAATQTSER